MSTRRERVAELTDDSAAVRSVVVLDPRRVARNLMSHFQDERRTKRLAKRLAMAHYPDLRDDEVLDVPDEDLSDKEAIERAFEIDPDLRAAFTKQRLTLADVTPKDAMTLERARPAAVSLTQERTMTSTELRRTAVQRAAPAQADVLATVQILAREEQERDSTLSDHDATARVFKRYPDLYREYATAASLERDGRTIAAARTTVTIEPKKPVSSGGNSAPSALAIIQAKTIEIMKLFGCSEAEARDRALAENPSLYVQYVAEMQGRGSSGASTDDED